MTRARIGRGHHAVVTGGSSGLGLEIARELVQRNVSVTLMARDEGRLDAARAELVRMSPSASVAVLSVDVADRDAVDAAFSTLSAVDMLVNSAGIMREGRVDTLTVRDFTDVLDVNVMGTVNAVQAVLPRLRTPGASIVTIASVAGLTGVFGYTSYCAAKHALVGFTHALKFEMEAKQIGVHLVCPGEFDSPLVEALDRTRSPENRAHVLTIPKVDVRTIAAETLRGVDRGTFLIVPGRTTKLLVTGQRLAPRVSDAIARRRIRAATRQVHRSSSS